MESLSLIHITPELPPTIGGIADYTSILTRRLVEVSDGRIDPVLVRAGWKDEGRPDVEFPVEDLGGVCSAGQLSERIKELAARSENRSVVLLEYSGYGYAKRGAPAWLVQGLKQACAEEKIPLVTMFHELYAMGLPWQSSFWLSPAQRYIAVQLMKMSSVAVTNRVSSVDWLQKYVTEKTPVYLQPVFSNVGEPDKIKSYEDRESLAVVFGGPAMKNRLYQSLLKNHLNWVENIGIKKIVDIGTADHSYSRIGKVPVEKKGVQPSKAISKCLSNARLGLMYYENDAITKSGIFGSFATHGVPSVLFSKDNINVIDADEKKINFKDVNGGLHKNKLPRSGQNLHHWYQENASSACAAAKFWTILQGIDEMSAKRL